jgi:hypothetical protein
MIRASRLLEILDTLGARTLCDPAMGLPTHLNYLKRHGIAVHGAESLEWLARAGDGIVVNDSTLLRDDDVAAIVEPLPARIYAYERFSAWEGASLGEEQCRYLAIWRENVRALRSDAQVGLAVLGLWRVFCYWLQKADAPDDMEDVAPSELAWAYVRQTTEWVGSNGHRNTARCGDALAAIDAHSGDALLLAPPSRQQRRNADPRFAMWEAWWRDNPFYAPEWREEPLRELLARATAFPAVVLVTDDVRTAEHESALREAQRRVRRVAISASEVYLIAERSETSPR